MKVPGNLTIPRVPMILRIILVVLCLVAMAVGLAAPDDWGYSGWLPRIRH